MSFKWISQGQLIWDWDLNPREKDESHIRALASHMNKDGYDPKHPIIVYKFEKVQEIYYAATGHHRLEATLLRDVEFPNLPLSEVYVEIIEGTHSEYVRRMLIDNFQHTPGFNKNIGKIPTRKELQQMRFQLLFFPDVFEKGDRLLATGWGCDHKTVSEVRNWFISKLTRGETPQPDYVSDSDIEKIKEIIASDLYLGKDGKKYPRTTKPVEPKLFGAPDPMEKYLELQKTLDRVIDSSLFGAINDNPVGKHNTARALKRAGCYAKGFQQAFLWDNRTDLSAEHVSHLEKANGVLQEIVIDVEIFTLNHEQNREKCKVYLNELYTKIESASEESQDKELDADLKEKLTDIFTMHGNIPIYNPLTQIAYSEELAEDSDLSAAEVYLQIGKFKSYISGLEKDVRKSLKKDPSWEYDSLACAMNLMQKDAGIVKTIMANIESHQQFLDKQNNPPQPEPVEIPTEAKPNSEKLRTDLSSLVDCHGEKTTATIKMSSWVSRDANVDLVKSILNEIYQERFGKNAYEVLPASTAEAPVQFEIDELDITLKVQKLNGKIYDYIFVKDISDMPEPLMAELTKFVKSHLEKR